MNHEDHVRLIERGVATGSAGVWADFGAGSGAFTLALRELAGPQVSIVAVDRDRGSLPSLRAAMERRFPGAHLRLLPADFTAPLALPPLDGIIAANTIHYVPTRDQPALLRQWREYLKPHGRLILVEYDADVGNRWVPYPLSFAALGTMAWEAGLTDPELLGSVPSRFLGRMYAASLSPATWASPAPVTPAGVPSG